jgi:hypothetical protein
MVLYKCEKCLKEFNKKHNYEVHINRKFSCNKSNIDKDFIIEKLTDEKIELQNKNEELEDIIRKANYKFQQLENENKTINELYKTLLDKCFENNKNLSNTICNNTNKSNNTNSNNTNSNNTTNITNNTINNINVKLVPFGMENIDDLTQEEKKTILNAGMFCSVMCAKKLNCNPRLPQYQNIAFTNLRSNDAKIYDKDKTWKTVDKEDLFETVIPRRIDDVNLLIENIENIENDDIKISPYMENLIKKGIEEDNVIKDEKVKKRFHRTVYDFNQNKNKTTITK